jgi:hypothetical protein
VNIYVQLLLLDGVCLKRIWEGRTGICRKIMLGYLFSGHIVLYSRPVYCVVLPGFDSRYGEERFSLPPRRGRRGRPRVSPYPLDSETKRGLNLLQMQTYSRKSHRYDAVLLEKYFPFFIKYSPYVEMVLIFWNLMIFMYDVCHFEKIREDELDPNVFSVRIILNRREPKL